ncbi:hypothetical protein [Alicyclobacillus sp. SO9]|uniref:hypothetical protein n=1 Tax=Alicyclobacillus sp. SO9 TaxID=2665646 RepID=UPI0018E83324|nr:hypothetical protein [Alicyclobacillus sp. SO9]QQE80952.1 hypothetical protein GI364_11505 [Alicyclobacillus sp. SO9]
MAVTTEAKLVWYKFGEGLKMVVKVAEEPYQRYAAKGISTARIVNLKVPVLKRIGKNPVVYSQPINLEESGDSLYTESVFAVLTGVKGQRIAGSKTDYRDLASTGKQTGKFIYVLPVTSVTDDDVWVGYVRTGRKRWIAVPCPRPSAVYNRISLRNLERAPVSVAARQKIEGLGIPMFNPEYFDKAKVY